MSDEDNKSAEAARCRAKEELDYERTLRRHEMLERQKNENQINRDNAIIYISTAGLGFCAYSAKDAGNSPLAVWFFIVAGVFFALTIFAVILSFNECEESIKAEQRKIGVENEGKSVFNGLAFWLFTVSIVILLLTFLGNFVLK